MSDAQQQQMIQDAMKAIAERRPGRTKLVYDKAKRTIVAVSESAQAPRALNITAEDADMFAIITISTQWLEQQWPQLARGDKVPIRLSSWDDGDAYTQFDLGPQGATSVGDGAVSLTPDASHSEIGEIRVAIAVSRDSPVDSSTFIAPDGRTYKATAWGPVNGKKEQIEVHLIDVQPALAKRRSGILETTVLKDKTVLFIGVGSGGAPTAIELAKCGVGHLILVDHDRLDVGNVVRHPGGISQVGRLKVNVLRDLIHEKNPDAKVSCIPIEVTYDSIEQIRPLVAQADVVVCGTDGRPSKLLVNRLCIEENTVAIYGGAFHRAYGGQVLRVRPKQSACHQCFVTAMPDEAANVEISSAAAAEGIAYADRPVEVQPGLSLDIIPIANMVGKLALLELVADKSSPLKVLARDYSAPWYLWVNRPEPGTPYADWPALSESVDEMTINRWYGIDLARDVECSACGSFTESIAASYGIDLDSLEAVPSVPVGD